MNTLLDKNVYGINRVCILLIVHKKAKPSPPNENPVTIVPKNMMLNTFQQLVVDNATAPNIHTYITMPSMGYMTASAMMPYLI